MNEQELDEVYVSLCRALTDVGEQRASMLLARFALLAMTEIGDARRVTGLIQQARDFES